MPYFDNDEKFQPDYNADLDVRINLFELELLELEKYRYDLYFLKRASPNEEYNHDRLWNHWFIIPENRWEGKTAAFGFNKTSDLDYRIKAKCFDVFFKHFPDGIQASLTGSPQRF